MADQSDVEQAFVDAISTVLYPGGDSTSGAGASLVRLPVRVYRGWPNSVALTQDLGQGLLNVSIVADPSNQTITTRFPDEWTFAARVASTMSAAVSNSTAVFSGDAGSGQIAGLLVDGFAGVHRTVDGDTPVSVAAALAAALVSRNAMSSGSSVLVLGARSMVARVVADQPAVRETRRQRQVFRVVCWCPDPGSRDALAGTIDAALSDIPFISLSDGLAARLRSVASVPTDRAQAAALYRRDLLYSVEYGTTVALDLPSLLFGNARLATNTGFVATHLS